MATYITSSVANTEGFIPSIWAQEALEILRNNINIARFCAKDSDFGEGAFAQVGQTLTIGYAGTFTPQDKTANTLLTASVPSNGSSAAVTLNKYKVVPFVIENIAQAQSNQNLMQRLLEPAVVGLCEQVETDLYGAAFTFSRASQGTIGTGIGATAAQQAALTLNIAKAPQQDRHLIVSPKDLASLEADSALQSYFAFNAAQNGVVEMGEFERPLYGMNLHMSQLTPSNNSGVVAHSLQTITITGTSGSFTVTYAGQTTGSIAYGASGATLEAALQGLSTIGVGMARVGTYDSTNKVYTIALYVATPAAFTTTPTTLTAVVADASSAITAYTNIAMHKNALLLATRPVRPAGGSTVMSAMIQDEVSGLTLNMEAQYNIQAMGLWVNLSILYGVTALRPDQAQVILS